MLTNDQMNILLLLRKSFGLSEESHKTEDAGELAEMIMRNSILLTVYPSLSEEDRETLKPEYNALLKQSILQEYEGELVLNTLNDIGIESIALKGWELRKLYPKSHMRQMADVDILVRPYDYKRIKEAMEKKGFRFENEAFWKHDSIRKDSVHIELHKRLMDDSDEIRRWEHEMWNRAIRVRGNIFRMSPEDYCLFHFIHLHKDFMNGSLGLRRIVDTWLLQKQPVDEEWVKANLAKFGMQTFYERMNHLSRTVMGEEPMDENSEILLAHAFNYGIYGSDESHKAGRIALMGKNLKNGKFQSALSAVFLPIGQMKAFFPVLEKCPVLLPWCWLKRIVRIIIRDRKQIWAKLNYNDINEDDYREAKRFFEAGGITRK